MTGARAFSLIEIMVVSAIVGVLAAITVPSITTMARTRAAAAEVSKVQAALDGARDDARARLRCVHVTRPTPSSLQFDELLPDSAGCGATVFASHVTQFKADAIAIGALDLTFDRAGSLTGVSAGHVDVSITCTPSSPATLRVYRALGLVRRL